jgi:hypothetical protein
MRKKDVESYQDDNQLLWDRKGEFPKIDGGSCFDEAVIAM